MASLLNSYTNLASRGQASVKWVAPVTTTTELTTVDAKAGATRCYGITVMLATGWISIHFAWFMSCTYVPTIRTRDPTGGIWTGLW